MIQQKPRPPASISTAASAFSQAAAAAESASITTGPASASAVAPASGAAGRVGSSVIRDLLTLVDRAEIISLAGGLPAPDTFPVAAIADAAAHVLATDASGALQYSPTEGIGDLRAWIADRVVGRIAPDGADGADGVVVTNGSQQAFDLVVRTLVDPGDAVALAEPAYVGALQVLRLSGAALTVVPSDDDGLCVDALADQLRAGFRPRLVYVVSNFHNPTGATLALDRRRALAALADRYGFVIVDDDPYGELRWSGSPVPSLASMSDRVVRLGSFSKILSPGLRVGYLVADPEFARSATILKQGFDLHTSTLTQRIVHRVVTRGGFVDDHLARIRPIYQVRADALSLALTRHLGDRITFTRPAGGMFMWVRFADPTIDTQALLDRALDSGMAFVPGAAFAVDRPERNSLRLSFASVGPAELNEGVCRLARALNA
jgi:2-aminoadipate transaminase